MKKLLFCLLSTLFSFGQSGIDSITFYIQKGEVNKAIQYGLKVKNQLELDNKKNTVYYANFLIDIGKMYSNQFRNAEAENYFIQGISILKDSLGENNLEYASKLYDFAFIYSFSEFSYKAEPLIIKSLTIRKEILGENSQEYLKSLNQLANYYYYKKNYLKAEPYLTEAIEKTKIIYGSDSNKLEDLLYNLAIIFEKQKKYEKSEKLWLEFISSKRKNDKLNRLKKTIFSLDDYICFVGNFYSNANNFNEAEKYFKEAIDYRLIFKGKDGNYSFLLGKLANLYLKYNKFEQAQKIYEQILNLRKIGKNKNNYFGDNLYVCLLATTYLNQGKIKKAKQNFVLSNRNFITQLINNIDRFSTNRDFDVFIKPNFYQKNYSLSFLHLFPNINLKVNRGCFENQLLLKNLSLRNYLRITKSIKEKNDIHLTEKYNKFILNGLTP